MAAVQVTTTSTWVAVGVAGVAGCVRAARWAPLAGKRGEGAHLARARGVAQGKLGVSREALRPWHAGLGVAADDPVALGVAPPLLVLLHAHDVQAHQPLDERGRVHGHGKAHDARVRHPGRHLGRRTIGLEVEALQTV